VTDHDMMIVAVLAVQVVLPVALLLWLALLPARSGLGLALQMAGIGAALLALALVAPGAVVPWWSPYVYGAVWAATALRHALRAHAARMALLPKRQLGWVSVAFGLGLLGVAGWYCEEALGARTLPAIQVVSISNPLGPGRYLVANGGSREIVNPHLRTLDPSVERYRAWRGQSYAIDVVGLNRWGTRAGGLRPVDPADYAIFGAEVHAPCEGDVLQVENGMPDLRVPEQDTANRLGNHVMLRCGEAVIVLAHLRQGSVAVQPGQTVTAGDPIGQVGNSGASTEPHLHVHAQGIAAASDPPVSGDPFVLRVDGRFLSRNDRIAGRDR
jgi:hypothetical protein